MKVDTFSLNKLLYFENLYYDIKTGYIYHIQLVQ